MENNIVSKSKNRNKYKIFKNWQLWVLITIFSLILFIINLIIFQLRMNDNQDIIANTVYFYSFLTEVIYFYFSFVCLPIFIILIFIWSIYRSNFKNYTFKNINKGYFKLFLQVWFYIIFQFLLLSVLYMTSGIKLYQYFIITILNQIVFLFLKLSLIMLFLTLLMILFRSPIFITIIFMSLFIIFSTPLFARTNSGSNLLSINNQLRPLKEKTFIKQDVINEVEKDRAFYLSPLASLKRVFDLGHTNDYLFAKYEVDKFTSSYSYVLLNYTKATSADFPNNNQCKLLVNKSLAYPQYYYDSETQEYKIKIENLENFLIMTDCNSIEGDDLYILDSDEPIVSMFNQEWWSWIYWIFLLSLVILILVVYKIKRIIIKSKIKKLEKSE